MKEELSLILQDILNKRIETQKELAKILGVSQPRISNMKKGDLKKYAPHKIMLILNLLGYDISININESKKEKGEINIYFDTKVNI